MREAARNRVASPVEFIGNWEAKEAYATLKGNSSVHDPQAMQEAWGDFGGLEARVGEWNVVDAALLSLLALYRRAVCIIRCNGVNHRGETTNWTGTGFLVGPNLLVTNHHVLNSESVAASATVDFEYERTPEEMLDSLPTTARRNRQIALQPNRLFVTSPVRGGLDYTFCWIGDDAAQEYGMIPMSRGSFTGRVYEPVFLIHHPKGELKRASLDDTELLNVEGDLLLYAADTDDGSSGAPVLTRSGKLCGLHHAYSADRGLLKNHSSRAKTLQDGGTYGHANEAIKFSAIALDLQERAGREGAQRSAIMEILRCFHDSDTLAGPYGAWGRSLESSTADEAKASDNQSKRDIPLLYLATEQDLDIAVWSLDWINAHTENTAIIKQVSTVLADITQDVWVLDGISTETATVLKNTFSQTFKQKYELAFADDETHPAQPLTAILYNTLSVGVERIDWPKHVEALWRTRAERDLGLETFGGPVFPSFPARFRVSVKGRKRDAAIDLVPLFVGNQGKDAQLRSTVAGLILPHIVDAMKTQREDGDWLIVGDVNTPLRNLRQGSLQHLGYTPILALDDERGGFGYLRNNRNSVLSQMFVPLGTERVFDDQGFVSVIEREFGGRFASALSNSTPFGTRIALLDDASARDVTRTRERLGTGSQLRSPSADWEWRGLTKSRFLSRNVDRFTLLLEQVNAAAERTFGSNWLPLTFTDMAVLIHCESGLKNGKVDPNARHSLGERGLLPLPSNIQFWIGNHAPANNQPNTLDANLRYYAHYLAAVKNKPVKNSPHGMLYRDLFWKSGIAENPVRQAKLLAGIIHGYFLPTNYRGGARPDFGSLMDGFQSDVPIPQMLLGSGYVFDGSTVLESRQRNVDTALSNLA